MASDQTYERELKERAIRQKQLDKVVDLAMKRVMKAITDCQPIIHKHFFYGASAIHPRHLVAWYLFHTDAEWQVAKNNGLIQDIDRLTRKELTIGGYPAESISQVMVSFTSGEEIQRETGGNYWQYFK